MSGLRPSLRPRDIPSHRRTAASRPVVREGRALQSFPGLGHRPPRTICFWSVAARGRGSRELPACSPASPVPGAALASSEAQTPLRSLLVPVEAVSASLIHNGREPEGEWAWPSWSLGSGQHQGWTPPGKQKTAFGSRGSRCFLPESGGPARSWPSFVVRFGVATSRTLVAGKQE